MGKILKCSPAERARAIIDSTNTREILEELSPQETYMIIKESWGTDSQILLQYMNPETMCHCIDMDCWEKDALSPEALLDWLWEIYNASVETLQDALQTIDLDILVVLYQSYIDVVQVVPTDEGIADLLDQGYETFDDINYFMFREGEEKIQLLRDILSLLFTHYQNVYNSIMEGVIWELRSSIEETIYENRSLRLMEIGFPPPDEAMGIYRRIKPGKILDSGLKKEKVPVMDEDRSLLPALYMDHLAENRSLIAAAIAESTPETRDRLVFEMIYLANKVIMADYRPLNELGELKLSIDKASAITSLGLAAAVREQQRSVHEVIENTNAETLFSFGYNMILDQKSRFKEILFQIDLAMIPAHLCSFTEGLIKKRPLFGNEEFSNIEQLDKVTHDMDMIEAMVILMGHLGWSKKSTQLKGTNTYLDTDMEAIILTSLAVNSLKGEQVFRPLHQPELREFVSRATRIASGGKRDLILEFRKNLTSFLQEIDPSLDKGIMTDVASLLLNRLEEELAGLKNLEDLDPRFISCFVVNL